MSAVNPADALRRRRPNPKKPWSYGCVRSSSHGLMRCHVCGKHITEGEYRYRATYKHFEHTGYSTGHRACTADDPMWALIDAQREESEARHQAFITACVEFKKTWGVDDLDDWIPDALLAELAKDGDK